MFMYLLAWEWCQVYPDSTLKKDFTNNNATIILTAHSFIHMCANYIKDTATLNKQISIKDRCRRQ